jgi:hypothetical protein
VSGKPSQCCSEDEISGQALIETKTAQGAIATSWPKRSSRLRVRALYRRAMASTARWVPASVAAVTLPAT